MWKLALALAALCLLIPSAALAQESDDGDSEPVGEDSGGSDEPADAGDESGDATDEPADAADESDDTTTAESETETDGEGEVDDGERAADEPGPEARVAADATTDPATESSDEAGERGVLHAYGGRWAEDRVAAESEYSGLEITAFVLVPTGAATAIAGGAVWLHAGDEIAGQTLLALGASTMLTGIILLVFDVEDEVSPDGLSAWLDPSDGTLGARWRY